jgi:hypothetical protein
MGREIKTISLDKTTAEIAANIPNFSGWVRNQLLIEWLAQGNEPIHTLPKGQQHYKLTLPRHDKPRDDFGRIQMETYNTGRCNPHHRKGRCPICWPDHLTIEEHVLQIASQFSQGIVDPAIPLGGEEE